MDALLEIALIGAPWRAVARRAAATKMIATSRGGDWRALRDSNPGPTA